MPKISELLIRVLHQEIENRKFWLILDPAPVHPHVSSFLADPCMKDTLARARTRPRPSARDDRVSCVQDRPPRISAFSQIIIFSPNRSEYVKIIVGKIFLKITARKSRRRLPEMGWSENLRFWRTFFLEF